MPCMDECIMFHIDLVCVGDGLECEKTRAWYSIVRDNAGYSSKCLYKVAEVLLEPFFVNRAGASFLGILQKWGGAVVPAQTHVVL